MKGGPPVNFQQKMYAAFVQTQATEIPHARHTPEDRGPTSPLVLVVLDRRRRSRGTLRHRLHLLRPRRNDRLEHDAPGPEPGRRSFRHQRFLIALGPKPLRPGHQTGHRPGRRLGRSRRPRPRLNWHRTFVQESNRTVRMKPPNIRQTATKQ